MSWDVVVWGGGTGGVAAAVQASRSGARTLLLTPGPWLGGMLSSAGVCAPDGHEISCWQTGLWGQFIRTLANQSSEGLDHNWVSCFGFRPEQAERLLQHWVMQESTLQWWSGCELWDVQRKGDRIQSIRVACNGTVETISGSQWIDGSDLGDLIAMADAPCRWGWESKETWNEPSAPEQKRLDQEIFFVEQPVQSPTWVVMGQLRGDRPEQFPRTPAPPFEGCSERFGLERTLTYGRLPGGLLMLNWPLNGNDWHQGLQRCISPEADQRAALAAEMQAHSLTFLRELERCSCGWLTAADAFPSTNPSLALMPYWREGRRLRGQATVTELDLLPGADGALRAPLSAKSIAVGTYANDHHYPGDDWPLAPKSCRWGGRWTGTPFCIPYEALLSDSISNLLAAEKCFSVSHMANGATRLQPLILNIGQAAGLAAALAALQRVDPLDLRASNVQHRLINDPVAPAAVVPLWEWPGWHPHWRDAQMSALNHLDSVDWGGRLEHSTRHGLELPQADQTPLEPKALEICGRLLKGNDQCYQLQRGVDLLSLITLEPGVERCLSQLPNNTSVRLIAVENPWGAWWRVLRILDQAN